jgi:polyisoprenoid-binding protein YceI
MAQMHHRIRFGALTIVLHLAVAWSSAPAFSQTHRATLRLDPANTRINFTLKGFPHNTTGSFKLKRGEIVVDPDTGNVDGSVIVDAASGSSGSGPRDSRMRDGVLEAQRYPEISFTPLHAEGRPVANGDFTVKVAGLMFLHGEKHVLTLMLTIHRSGDNFTATGEFTVPYVKWGLKDPSLLFLTVSDEVIVDLNTAGHVTWTAAP